MSASFSPWTKICSSPFLSSNRISLNPSAAERAVRLRRALRLLPGQLVRRHLVRVVHAPRDQRTVRVPLQKVDHHLLADPRSEDRPVLPPGERRGHPDPARALLVLVVPPVPVKLHLHAAVLVRVDLLPVRTRHHRRLDPLHHRLRRHPRGAERNRRRDRRETARIAELGAPRSPRRLLQRLRLLPARDQLRQEVLPVVLPVIVVGQRELEPRHQPHARALPFRRLVVRHRLLEPDLRQLLPAVRLHVPPRVVVHLQLLVDLRLLVLRQVQPRLLEVVVPPRHLPGTNLPRKGEPVHALLRRGDPLREVVRHPALPRDLLVRHRARPRTPAGASRRCARRSRRSPPPPAAATRSPGPSPGTARNTPPAA